MGSHHPIRCWWTMINCLLDVEHAIAGNTRLVIAIQFRKNLKEVEKTTSSISFETSRERKRTRTRSIWIPTGTTSERQTEEYL